MTTFAVRNNILWTPEEDDLLRKLAASGKNLAGIAKEINRPPRVSPRPRSEAECKAGQIGSVNSLSGVARPV